MTDITIKRLETLEDDKQAFLFAQACFNVGRDLGFFPAHRSGPDGTENAVLAMMGDEPVGFATFYDTHLDNVVWLDLVFVLGVHRHKRIGTFILMAVLDEIRGSNRNEVRLQFGTGLNNAAMAALGRAVGFEQETMGFTTMVRGRGFENLHIGQPWAGDRT